MTLRELAFACHVYRAITDDDRGYREFQCTTCDSPDLTIADHRLALLKWLNNWGCRQFAIRYHDLASEEIRRWWEECGALLPSKDRNLWELDESEVSSAGSAFGRLCERTASHRRGSVVSVGATGAAKALFAVRPRTLPPWDGAIRISLGYAATDEGYRAYLLRTKSVVLELAQSCERAGFPLERLPNELGQPQATVPKLVDEYYWVTIIWNCPIPDSATLQRWLRWG